MEKLFYGADKGVITSMLIHENKVDSNMSIFVQRQYKLSTVLINEIITLIFR